MYQYSLRDILLDPESFNSRAVNSLRTCYSDKIDLIFDRLSVEINAIDKYRIRIERHLFPAFLIAEWYGSIDSPFLEYCYCFVKGYSLPIILLNNWLDTNKSIDKENLCETFALLYSVQASLLALPNGPKIVERVNGTYTLVTQSLLSEFRNRYQFKDVDIESIFEDTYYRSICGYLSAVVGGTLELLEVPISQRLERLLYFYGVLRQVVDEICDLQEDLKHGIVTLPIYYALQEIDIKNDISRFWGGKANFREIEQFLHLTHAYEKCFKKGMDIYHKCIEIKESLQEEYPFLHKIFVMYDLKLCQLCRLKKNRWLDNLPLQ